MIAERLKLLRKEHGYTQKEAAEGAGIIEQLYQKYEYGNKPAYDNLLALADFFNCSVDYLMGRTDNPEVNR